MQFMRGDDELVWGSEEARQIEYEPIGLRC